MSNDETLRACPRSGNRVPRAYQTTDLTKPGRVFAWCNGKDCGSFEDVTDQRIGADSYTYPRHNRPGETRLRYVNTATGETRGTK